MISILAPRPVTLLLLSTFVILFEGEAGGLFELEFYVD